MTSFKMLVTNIKMKEFSEFRIFVVSVRYLLGYSYVKI